MSLDALTKTVTLANNVINLKRNQQKFIIDQKEFANKSKQQDYIADTMDEENRLSDIKRFKAVAEAADYSASVTQTPSERAEITAAQEYHQGRLRTALINTGDPTATALAPVPSGDQAATDAQSLNMQYSTEMWKEHGIAPAVVEGIGNVYANNQSLSRGGELVYDNRSNIEGNSYAYVRSFNSEFEAPDGVEVVTGDMQARAGAFASEAIRQFEEVHAKDENMTHEERLKASLDGAVETLQIVPEEQSNDLYSFSIQALDGIENYLDSEVASVIAQSPSMHAQNLMKSRDAINEVVFDMAQLDSTPMFSALMASTGFRDQIALATLKGKISDEAGTMSGIAKAIDAKFPAFDAVGTSENERFRLFKGVALDSMAQTIATSHNLTKSEKDMAIAQLEEMDRRIESGAKLDPVFDMALQDMYVKFDEGYSVYNEDMKYKQNFANENGFGMIMGMDGEGLMVETNYPQPERVVSAGQGVAAYNSAQLNNLSSKASYKMVEKMYKQNDVLRINKSNEQFVLGAPGNVLTGLANVSDLAINGNAHTLPVFQGDGAANYDTIAGNIGVFFTIADKGDWRNLFAPKADVGAITKKNDSRFKLVDDDLFPPEVYEEMANNPQLTDAYDRMLDDGIVSEPQAAMIAATMAMELNASSANTSLTYDMTMQSASMYNSFGVSSDGTFTPIDVAGSTDELYQYQNNLGGVITTGKLSYSEGEIDSIVKERESAEKRLADLKVERNKAGKNYSSSTMSAIGGGKDAPTSYQAMSQGYDTMITNLDEYTDILSDIERMSRGSNGGYATVRLPANATDEMKDSALMIQAGGQDKVDALYARLSALEKQWYDLSKGN